jgi:hypothetical protein
MEEEPVHRRATDQIRHFRLRALLKEFYGHRRATLFRRRLISVLPCIYIPTNALADYSLVEAIMKECKPQRSPEYRGELAGDERAAKLSPTSWLLKLYRRRFTLRLITQRSQIGSVIRLLTADAPEQETVNNTVPAL